MTIRDVLHYLDCIERKDDGGFEISSVEAREFYRGFLWRQGYRLSQIKTHTALIEAIRDANAMEFDQLLQRPAPMPALRFIWEALRKLAR